MASWAEIAAAEPSFAAAVRARFDAHVHKTMATLRADGSPRISGIEATIGSDELWLGMMPDSRKVADLERDPRVALHSGTIDTELNEGDAKIAGRVELLDAPEAFSAFRQARGDRADDDPEAGSFPLYRVDIAEVVLLRVGDPRDHLVIETWREGAGFSRVERR